MRTAHCLWMLLLPLALDASAGATQAADPPPVLVEMTSTPIPPPATNGRAPLSHKTIDQINLDTRLEGKLPGELSAGPMSVDLPHRRPERALWSDLSLHWVTLDVSHRPLYFDDVPLERYGQAWDWPWQSVRSGVRFYADVFLVPWNYAVLPSDYCEHTVGYDRMGSPTPCMRQRLAWPRPR